jgi:hypothetical protein
MRIGSRVQGARDPSKGDDVSGTAEVDAIFGGRVHKAIGWQANFVGTIGREGETAASILDLHAKFELHDLANLWVGRMLVPSDRSNFSGPWFTSPWHYPGVFGSTFIGPKTGKFGRDNGATFWGQVMGGHFKYYVGAYDLQDANNSPLYSGRINISLLNPEPGYYHSSTYYGEKDIVALGVGFQSQKNGVVTRDMMGNVVTSEDLVTFNTDLLVEKKLGGAGTVTGEAAYFKFNDKQATDYYYLALLSYLTPKKLGWGYLQPLVRLQQAKPRGAADDMWTLFDGQLGYVISQYAARLALGYQRTDMGTMNGNAFFAGVQIQR